LQTKKKKKEGARKTTFLPVMTTGQWREHKRLELKRKEDECSKKLEKKQERERKKTEREKQVAEKQACRLVKKQQRKRQTCQPDVEDRLEEEAVDDPTPIKKKKKGKLEPSSKYTKKTEILVGDWVTITYDKKKYPGIVTAYDATDDEYEVKTMSPIQYQLQQCWRWPAKEDKIFYSSAVVSKYTGEPVRVQGKGRAEGLFQFYFL
jgi:hypothetical protein